MKIMEEREKIHFRIDRNEGAEAWQGRDLKESVRTLYEKQNKGKTLEESKNDWGKWTNWKKEKKIT